MSKHHQIQAQLSVINGHSRQELGLGGVNKKKSWMGFLKSNGGRVGIKQMTDVLRISVSGLLVKCPHMENGMRGGAFYIDICHFYYRYIYIDLK